MDCVNSISGNHKFKIEEGLKTPRRSAPLAKGGSTNGITTTTKRIDLPGKLYLDRQYANGIPNNIIIPVETEAVTMLSMNASTNSGL